MNLNDIINGSTVFIDTNVPMYLVGAPHPNKVMALNLIERAIRARERLITDAEVLEEILHRYTHIGRRDAIRSRSRTRSLDPIRPTSAANRRRRRPAAWEQP